MNFYALIDYALCFFHIVIVRNSLQNIEKIQTTFYSIIAEMAALVQ